MLLIHHQFAGRIGARIHTTGDLRKFDGLFKIDNKEESKFLLTLQTSKKFHNNFSQVQSSDFAARTVHAGWA